MSENRPCWLAPSRPCGALAPCPQYSPALWQRCSPAHDAAEARWPCSSGSCPPEAGGDAQMAALGPIRLRSAARDDVDSRVDSSATVERVKDVTGSVAPPLAALTEGEDELLTPVSHRRRSIVCTCSVSVSARLSGLSPPVVSIGRSESPLPRCRCERLLCSRRWRLSSPASAPSNVRAQPHARWTRTAPAPAPIRRARAAL